MQRYQSFSFAGFLVAIALIAVLIFPATSIAFAATYYVATTGSDSNSGTISSPFRTINHGLALATAGSTVYVRGGSYYEQVVFPNSGSSGNLISLLGYPGETAAIDGSNFTVGAGRYTLVAIDSKNYIYIGSIDIRNYYTTALSSQVNGITVTGSSSNVTVANCNIYNIQNNASSGRQAHGFEALGNASSPMTNLTVQNCNITNCHTGTSEACTVNGYIDGFTISGNQISNCDNIGIDAAGGYGANGNSSLDYVRNGSIRNNNVHDCPIDIGIYCDGSRNIVIEGNWVWNDDRGIGAVSETNNFPSSNIIIRSNAVYNCNKAGIYIGGYIGYTTGGTTNCKILNNTIYNNDAVLGAFGEVEGEISIRENATNNTIKNNIIYARTDNTDIFVRKYTTTGSGNVINYNMYYKPSGTNLWMWNGTSYSSFASWKTASGQDGNSVNGVDPKFVSVGSTLNLQKQSSSPAVNTGSSDTDQGSLDIYGSNRVVGTIDKGADEVVTATIANGAHTLTPLSGTGTRLDDAGSGTTNGNKVEIWAANGTSAQSWTFTNIGGTTFKVTVVNTSTCLDDMGGGQGVAAGVWSCNGGTNQSWTALATGSNYQLRNGAGMCLDVSGAGTANGTSTISWPCNSGDAAQVWTVN